MRTRDLKPDFWTDEKVVLLSDGAKLLFQGLWNLADREGRLEDKPTSIGFKVRPWDPGSVPSLLAELEQEALIVRYEVNGVRVIWVPNLPLHQRFHPREMKSKLPPPPGGGGAGRGKARQGTPRQVIASGSAGPSGSAKPSGPAGPSGSSGSAPPLPPSDEGGSKERSCTCTRQPCRHEKAAALAPPPPPSTPEGIAWRERLDVLRKGGAAYAASQLEQLEPVRLVGTQLQVRAADRYFQAWVIEHYAVMLAELDVVVLAEPEAPIAAGPAPPTLRLVTAEGAVVQTSIPRRTGGAA